MTTLVVENSPSDPVARLGDWLTAGGLDLTEVRPHLGEAAPEGVDGLTALVVMGGPQAAYGDTAWLPEVKELLRRAVGGGVPTLGVCLGGQLLADALGGRVELAPDGPELGAGLVAKRDAAGADPVFGDIPFTPDVLQWHFDAITELPPDATLLASSTRYPHQAFRVGTAAWGVQFHIETTPAIVRDWAARTDFAALGIDGDAVLARAAAVHPDLEDVWAPVAKRFAAFALDRS